MSVCLLHHAGDLLVHRTMQARPATLLRPLTPSRQDIVGAVDCVFPWSWLADLWAREGMPCGRGHARSLTARHGGTATNDTSDAHKLAGRLRGGLCPPAYGSPAKRRATRDLLRRRRPLTRQRAALLAHLQHPQSPDPWPASGTKVADTANRAGGAARCPAPAGPKRLAVDLALLGDEAPRRNALAVPSVTSATQPAAQTLSLLQPVPGSGKMLRLVLL
jgi:hypothetical protein